jgi:hypothetical protein
MAYKGILHPYSYKMMNLNKKNQSIKEENFSSSILSNAITVQNLHKKVIGNNYIETKPNIAPIVFENIDLNKKKRPTTSKWNSDFSNLSYKLNNPYISNNNNAYDKNKNLKSLTNKNRVSNVYFNKYIDIQFRPANVLQKTLPSKLTNPNVSNRDESYNFINPTANERFLNDKFANIEKKNVKINFFLFFFSFFII